MVVQETDEHLDDGADSSSEEVVAIFYLSQYVQGAQGTNVQGLVGRARMVMDAINMLRSSDEEMAHAAVVEVGFLWSPSSALTSPPTIQVQQMLNLSRGGNSDEDEDDSSSEEVLAIFILGFYVNIVLSLSGGS